jgi:hypothetical protein
MANQTYKAKLDKEKKVKMSLPNWKPKKTSQEIKSENFTRNQMKYNRTHNNFGVGWGGEKPYKLPSNVKIKK